MKHYRTALAALTVCGVLVLAVPFLVYRGHAEPRLTRIGPLSITGTADPKLAEQFLRAFNAHLRPGAPHYVKSECRRQESGWARCSGLTLSPYGVRCVLWLARPVRSGWRVLAMSENPDCPEGDKL